MMFSFLYLACLVAATAAAPVTTYDQRQDGEFNVRADVQNVVFLVAIPSKMDIPDLSFLGLRSDQKQANRRTYTAQDRADVHVMEAFVEPSRTYQVEIDGGSDRAADGDGRAVEVVIAGRRRLDPEPLVQDELKGAEPCGVDSERDPDTLKCRLRAVAPVVPPAIVPISS